MRLAIAQPGSTATMASPSSTMKSQSGTANLATWSTEFVQVIHKDAQINPSHSRIRPVHIAMHRLPCCLQNALVSEQYETLPMGKGHMPG